MIVRFKKLVQEAVMPKKAHASDAGFDLTAVDMHQERFGDYNIVYHTGIAVEIPEGYVGLVFPRSSVAATQLLLTNSVGVIDSGYRGEILMKFRNPYDAPAGERAIYHPGDRIGQLIVLPYPEVEFEEAAELSESERGTGGYGSTGK